MCVPLGVERVGQLVEPRPQTFVFALAAFIFAPFGLSPLISIRLPAALFHPSGSPFDSPASPLIYLAKALK